MPTFPWPRHEINSGKATDAALLRRELVVHETRFLAPEEDTSIQDVFRSLVEDQERTGQICSDVHAALAAGRTCLVLTQRIDHIESIVAYLAALGDETLVLRGGLGKKAQAAVTERLTGTDDGHGLVLIATGSHLGEGFDWPALDTLFLAFPIAFKGRVAQYVGRLLRSHEGKHNVELHDYVDVRVPVLDRMHTKRLPAYATLGFETPRSRSRKRVSRRS